MSWGHSGGDDGGGSGKVAAVEEATARRQRCATKASVRAPGSIKLDQRERVRGDERVKVVRVEHDDVLLLGKRGGGRTSGEG